MVVVDGAIWAGTFERKDEVLVKEWSVRRQWIAFWGLRSYGGPMEYLIIWSLSSFAIIERILSLILRPDLFSLEYVYIESI